MRIAKKQKKIKARLSRLTEFFSQEYETGLENPAYSLNVRT
jgi:hypothetical protein